MRKFLIVAAAFAVPMMAGPAMADAHMEAAPTMAEKEWYNVSFIKFHPGKAREGMELIEAFEAVDEALGREGPIQLHMNTGEWDMMVAFKMVDGIAEMGWERNPKSEAWDAEFARQMGGEEAAAAHWQKFQSTVANSRSEIAHMDLD